MFRINQDKLGLLRQFDYENTINDIWVKDLIVENGLEFCLIINPYGAYGEFVVNNSGVIESDADCVDMSVSCYAVYREINKLIEIGVVEVVE